MKSAVIFCNGVISDYSYFRNISFKDKLLICADGGLRHMNILGIVPDVFIGDNDSWQGDYPKSAEVIKCKTEKDYTDTMRCVDYAIDNGCKYIEIYGGIGGRCDQEFSHYCLLSYGLSRGAQIKLINENNVIWMTDKSFTLNRSDKKYVSFFPYGGFVEGFSIKGLKYNVENMLLSCDLVQASSNEFVDNRDAEISFNSGKLLVMLCDDIGVIR